MAGRDAGTPATGPDAAPPATRPQGPTSIPEEPERAGHRVVLVLFFILALCVIAVLTVFGAHSPESVQDEIPVLIARNLYIPVVATSLLVAIDARRRGRSGWWVYLATAPVPVVNVALAVAWLMRWRDRPRPVGRWTM